MIPKKTLQAHYKEYENQSDEWVGNMEITKKSIIKYILNTIKFRTSTEPIKVTILGASDKRYLSIHKKIFEEILKKKIQIITFDFEVNHLGGGSKNVICQDLTKTFSNSPHDIIFSHELMKFLTPGNQIKMIKNSYNALSNNGLAMHIIHTPSIKGTAEFRDWQYRVNPDSLIKQLKKNGIPTIKFIFDSESDVDWLRKTTVIVIKKNSQPQNRLKQFLLN